MSGPALLLLLVLAAFPGSTSAGDWHYGASAVCTDCHTQHNSENGAPMRTDNVAAPVVGLLLRETPLQLCLSCHDGSNPSAPDVVAPVTYVADAPGGAFANSGDTASPHAHNLNNPTTEVPPGGTIAMKLTCTTCHDPHGNENYRNLRPDPTRTNLTPVTVVALQSTYPNGTNPSSVYVKSNIVDKTGVTAWCNTCHGPSPDAGSLSGHPSEVTIWGSMKTDYAWWSGQTFTNRMRVGNPSDSVVPSTDDRVTCFSCHKAHGSDNDFTLIYANGVDLDSTCQQCHNQ